MTAVASHWRERVEDMLRRLKTMQPPNVVLQQITMLGEAAGLLREAIAGEGMVREFLTRAKVPGKDYLYCIKPKELDALFAAAPEPEVQGAMGAILAEVERATRKFPTWPTDPLHAVAVVNEEVGELNKALLQAVYEPHKSTHEDVATEAIQAAAMAYRFVASLDRYNYAKCEQHEQPPLAAAPSAVDEAMERRAFEAWWRSTGSSFELTPDPNWPRGYAVSQVQCAWQAWLAALTPTESRPA